MLTVAPSLCALVYGALLAAASTGITYPLVKQRIPSALAERAGSGASLTIDPPQYAYTTDIGIGNATYKVVVVTATPQTTLGKSANYRGGKDTGKVGKGELSGGKNYTVKVYEDSITVAGVSAMTALGATDQMEVILSERGTTTHPVGILGLAPDSSLGFSAMDKNLQPFVSTSNKVFAIDLAANTLTFGDSFSPGFWQPLSNKGYFWNVDGSMDGRYNFEAATIEAASDTISVDLASAKSIFAAKKLNATMKTINHAQVLAATVDCATGGPAFSLSFGSGKTMRFTGKETVVREENQCLYVVQGMDIKADEWVLGWPLFKKKGGVVFDIKQTRVGLNT